MKNSNKISIEYLWISLLIVVAVAVRIRLLSTPLERDEGEFAYIAQLLLKGTSPFISAYSMKVPGVPFLYAIFMAAFGQSPLGIHAGLLVVNCLTVLLLFLIARKLFNSAVGVMAATCFTVLSAGSGVLGLFAHATHFVIFFAMTGLFLLISYLDRQNWILLIISGVCFGLSFTMKQHGIYFSLCAILYLCWYERSELKFDCKRIIFDSFLLLMGAVVPFFLLCSLFWTSGSFATFWFWTFSYARVYASYLPFSEGIQAFVFQMKIISKHSLPLWMLAAAGLALLNGRAYPKKTRVFMLALTGCSFAALCTGFYFRAHYFIMVLPVISILAALATEAASQKTRTLFPGRHVWRILPVMFFLSAGITIYKERVYFFETVPKMASRMVYGSSFPFVESLEVARIIKNETTKEDRIMVLGSEPQIYFYSDRKSASGYIYMYSLMERQKYAFKMQQEMINEIEESKPSFIVFVNMDTSWLAESDSLRFVFSWAKSYLAEHYFSVGSIAIPGARPLFEIGEYEFPGVVQGGNIYLYKRRI